MRSGHEGEVVLITGYPGFRARRLVEYLLAREPGSALRILVHPRRSARAQAEVERWAPAEQARVQLVEGDPSAIDFGLSREEYWNLAHSVQVIYHLYQVADLAVSRSVAEAINVGGVREVIELGRVCRSLRQIVHFSSTLVSGDHNGRFLEADLDVGQSFPAASEETLARAERTLMQEKGRLPFVILRPGITLGDPDSEFEPLHLLHAIVAFIVGATDEVGFPFPLRQEVQLNIVPLQFVIEFAHRLSTGTEEPGQVFQLVDPDSPSVRRFVEAVAAEGGKRLAPTFNAGALTRGLFRNAGLGLLRRSPRALFELLSTPVAYGTENAQRVLTRHAMACPPLQSYLPPLVRAAQAGLKEGRRLAPRTSEAAELAG